MARDPRFDGKFFVLVNSTGIFCRPICRARAPLESNVEYAASAAEAMQRGFRPCLRCRPDSAPQSFAWLGVENTARRAARLLTEDFSASIESVAQRLGVSTRYLHKIMQGHLRIAPKQFRIFHQLLLAKRLLQGSNMSIEQVAMGAGFSSARQLQHHMNRTMGLSPSKLRNTLQSNKKSNIERTQRKVTLLLDYQGDYDWPATRAFFARRLLDYNEAINDTTFTKTLNIHDQAICVEMRHRPEKSGFDVSFPADFVGLTSQIIAHASKILDLQANPYVIAEALSQAGLLQSQINFGLRIPGIASYFEAGVRAIMGQQVSVQAAITQLNRLQQGVVGNNNAFMTPQQLAQADLGFLKLPASRKTALKDFAQLMLEGDEQDFAQWLAIKGIGPWTVNYVKLRASDNTDVWLNTDLIIKQQIAAFQKAGQNIDDGLASPWRSYLTLTMWSLS